MNYKKIITLIILLFIRIDKVISIDINEINNFDDEFENIFNEEKPTIRKLAHYDALSILTAIKFPSAIYSNIYTQTYPIAERSIFSFPSMLLYHSEHVPSLECLSNLWRFNLFFNQTKKTYFGSSCHINEYLEFEENPIFKLDENVQEQIKSANLSEIIDIVKNGKISERRVGAYLQYLHNFDCSISLEIDIPFFYQERNYYLEENEIMALDICSKKAGLNKSTYTREEQETRMAKYAVSDKVGFGDTTIRLGWWLNPNLTNPLKAGLLLRIPTAVTVKEEIIGSYFKRDLTEPYFDIYKLMCLIQQDPEAGGDIKKAIKIREKLLLRVTNRLSSILLDRPLGYEHFGIGFFIDNYIIINCDTSLRWAINTEYLLPDKELRFFCYSKKEADFNIEKFEKIISNYDPYELDPILKKEIKETFDFINKHILGTLMPSAICANVTPGFIIQFTAGPQINKYDWQINAGYDLWYQHKEKINKLYNHNYDETYDIEKGIRPNIYQLKLFQEVRRTFKTGPKCFSFGIHADEAIITKGIGRDFNLAIDLQILF